MGTFYVINYRGEIKEEELKKIVDAHFEVIDSQLSNWNEDSWISNFNSSFKDEYIHTPIHVYNTLKKSIELHNSTGGVIDPTLGNLIDLWGFGTKPIFSMPDSLEVKTALSASGIDNIIFNENSSTLLSTNPNIKLEFSFLAKGYAADFIAKEFDRLNIKNYAINIGGDMKIRGRPNNKSLWRVEIHNPNLNIKNDELFTSLNLEKGGLATSGNYQKYTEIQDEFFPHFINPITGWPARSNLVSATIIASTSLEADAYATACMILGTKNAIKLIEGIPNVEGLFIEKTTLNEALIKKTSGWESFVYRDKL